MLTLGSALARDADVTIAAPLSSPLLRDAARAGLGVKATDPGGVLPPRRWFGRAGLDLVHVHAGIGWEGNRLVVAAREAGIGAVLRTEHLPYVLTDEDQREDHATAVAAADRLICVSHAVRDSHIDAGIDPERMAVIRNGVFPSEPTRDRESVRRDLGIGDVPLLLTVGRFERQKGHAVLLDSIPAILEEYPEAVFLLVGDGPLLGPVAQELVARGLAGSVRMTGRSDDVASLLAAADLFVLPSLFEGLPLAVLEAMAAGLPIVATGAPGTTEAIEPDHTGWLTPVGDPVSLARTIVAALTDPVARARVAQAARDAFDAGYRAERMVAETTALYQTLIADRPIEGNSMTRTRIGFIGAGGIAHRHFNVLDQFDDVEIVAVCDTDFARATDAAARFGARAFDDAKAMLDAVPVDAVYICVPPFAHGAPERAVLRRGLPFFVEKPVALDLETARAIADDVAQAGVVTAVGYHWRYLDTVDEVRGMLERNPARLLSGYWLDSTPPPRWWWREDRSGGQMVEQTTHLLDLARYLVGDVTRAYGLAGRTDRAAFPGLDVPTVSSASLLFADGTIGNFTSTCLLDWNHRVGLHLFGEGFAIELTDHDSMIDTGNGRPVRQAKGDPVEREDRDFIDAVQGKENRIRCPYADAVATHALALAVGESARSGQPVTFDTLVAKEPAHV